MLSDRENEFFETGLQKYGEALKATHAFRDALEEALQNAMLAIPKDSLLTLAPEPNFTTNRGTPPSMYYSVVGPLAEGVSNGRIPGGRLDIGVWWEPPFSSRTRIAVYAGVSGTSWSRRITKPAEFAGGLYKGPTTAYLTSDIETPGSFGRVVTELLTNLASAVSTFTAEGT
jgi:hypothetical protein